MPCGWVNRPCGCLNTSYDAVKRPNDWVNASCGWVNRPCGCLTRACGWANRLRDSENRSNDYLNTSYGSKIDRAVGQIECAIAKIGRVIG